MNNSFNLIHDRFKLRRRHRPLFARLQQPLQNLLSLETFSSSIFFDHNVWNFVNSLVRGEPPLAFQAFAPPPDHIAGTPFARINHLVIQMPAKRTFHSRYSPLPPGSTLLSPPPACAAISFNSSFSC